MGANGRTPTPGAVAAKAREGGVPPSGGRKAAGSLAWAVALPAVMILGAGVGQWVTWIGVVVMLAAVAAAACLIGGVWHRAGAATTASVAGFLLMLFAGPAVYEAYMTTVGEPASAVVTEVSDRHNRRGADMFCSVRETGGDRATYEVSQQENCFGQAEVGDRVEIRKDPLGLLDRGCPTARTRRTPPRSPSPPPRVSPC